MRLGEPRPARPNAPTLPVMQGVQDDESAAVPAEFDNRYASVTRHNRVSLSLVLRPCNLRTTYSNYAGRENQLLGYILLSCPATILLRYLGTGGESEFEPGRCSALLLWSVRAKAEERGEYRCSVQCVRAFGQWVR